jgi:Fur family peroxide stress response transcriptional regulator
MTYNNNMATSRSTKYTTAVTGFIQKVSHATNAQILAHLQLTYPELSATTVHRITARMIEHDQLALAPTTRNNAMRFDANLAAHDHFQCLTCSNVHDITIPEPILESIKQLTAGCKLTGRLTIQGTCQTCLTLTEEL